MALVSLLLLPAAAWCAAAAAPEVMYVDCEDSGYIANTKAPLTLNGEGLAASLAALLSSRPAFAVSPHISRQVRARACKTTGLAATRSRCLRSTHLPE